MKEKLIKHIQDNQKYYLNRLLKSLSFKDKDCETSFIVEPNGYEIALQLILKENNKFIIYIDDNLNISILHLLSDGFRCEKEALHINVIDKPFIFDNYAVLHPIFRYIIQHYDCRK